MFIWTTRNASGTSNSDMNLISAMANSVVYDRHERAVCAYSR